jgi:hypothetical protein
MGSLLICTTSDNEMILKNELILQKNSFE